MATRLQAKLVQGLLPPRAANAHKGSYGTLHIIAGSAEYRGAAVLCASGALRSGPGLVKVAATEKVCAAIAAALPPCILMPQPEAAYGGIQPDRGPALLAGNPSAVVAGSGMGNHGGAAGLVGYLLLHTDAPLLLDADAINCLAGHMQAGQDDTVRQDMHQLLHCRANPTVLTPHIGEMARLTGLPTTEVSARQEELARAFAAGSGCVVVLKSHVTIIAGPGGETYINDEAGNAGLAKGGSGDVLSGIIGGLLAQGIPPLDAAVAGVWLHARAADIAAESAGLYALSPSDLPGVLGKVFKELER